ncbi:MAG: ATP-grasp domain-containing protein [Sulfurimonadaceae bacterium]|nr:ATP-grasp domain-containing protein [Sulfurimonadaceae bacterium]
MGRKVGMWMYTNSGGDMIQEKIRKKLIEREIEVVTGLDLRFANADKHGIICNGTNMCELDLFFSYNAGEQTVGQLYQYETLSHIIPTVNNYQAFILAEDKFRTNLTLASCGVATSDFFICHRERPEEMVAKFEEWGKMVFKPLDGWGGVGMALIENRQTLDTVLPFLNQTGMRNIYIERFIKNDYTDFRIDIVDGEFIACYGRKANNHDWRTNVTSGGSVILREPNDEVVRLAKSAAKAIGLEIAGIDLLYDQEREEYVVLEVNGIPAFATPEQEAMGLDFNDKKIDKIVELIDRTTF